MVFWGKGSGQLNNIIAGVNLHACQEQPDWNMKAPFTTS